MANELSVYYPIASLSTLYFTITKSPNLAWNGSAFEVTNPGRWPSYSLAGHDNAGIGTYLADFPAGIAPGTYSLYGYRKVGSSPASTDTLIGTQLDVTWNGSAIVTGGTVAVDALTGSGTTLGDAIDSTLWGTVDRLIAANSFSAEVRGFLRMPRQGQAQQFWEGFEDLATAYFGGLPVDASDALARLRDYSTALEAQAQVAKEIVALVAANVGTLHTAIDSTGTVANLVRTFP